MSELKILKEQELLGRQFKMYGTIQEPLFLAKDVAEWIEHSNTSKMLSSVDENEKIKLTIGTLTNSYTALFLTEDGLYEVLMQSRKPIAKEFKNEVKKILKQIRLTGGYIPTSSEDDDKTIMAKALFIANKTIERQNKTIEEMSLKTEEYDTYLNSKGLYSINQVAKMLEMGEYKLFAKLRENKILFYQGKDNVPFERFRKSKCFKVIGTVDYKGDNHSTTYVTPKGVSYICRILKLINPLEVQA